MPQPRNVTTAVAERDNQTAAVETLRDAIKKSEGQFANALPSHVDSKRFLRAALTALGTVKDLQKCTQLSVLAGLMQAAQLGLEVSDVRGQCFLIPRQDNRDGGVYKATFQLGYRGMIDLAARSGITVDVDEICAGDTYDYQRGTEPRLFHKPALTDRGETIAYYAVGHFSDDRKSQFVIIGKPEAEAHRDRFAASKTSGPWITDFDAMARKTVVRMLLNYLPVSVELRTANAIDATGVDPDNATITYMPRVDIPSDRGELAAAAPPDSVDPTTVVDTTGGDDAS